MNFANHMLFAIYQYDHVDDHHLSSRPRPNDSFNIWYNDNEQYLDCVIDWFDLHADDYHGRTIEQLVEILCARLRYTRQYWNSLPIGCSY